MHDHGPTKHVSFTAGADLNALDDLIHVRNAVGICMLIGDVARVVRWGGRMAVCFVPGVEVSAGAAGVGCAAIPVLVDMEPVDTVWLKPAQLASDMHAIAGSGER